MKRIVTLALVSVLSASCFAQHHPGADEFAAKAAAEYGLDPNTVLELTKVKAYVQTAAPVVGEDGIVSFFAITDLALAEQ